MYVDIMCLFFLHKQVFNKLIRRYKYLEKGLEDEIKKVRVKHVLINQILGCVLVSDVLLVKYSGRLLLTELTA